MKRLFLVILLQSLFLASALNCQAGEDYIQMLRCTTDFSEEEDFSIMDGSSLLYEQEYTYDYMEDEFEECLPSSTNHIYTLLMTDSMSDSWSDESTISIYGVNGNLVLKAMMVNLDTETYNFALYSPINKGATWKYASAFASGWTEFSFADSAWTDVTLGATTQRALDTQYFRKTFAGSSEMTVMEAQFKYMYGIVAYVNGVEVFRDNMPSGEVTATTPSSGSYTSLDFHGVIRLAEGAASAQAVLAVELHFTAGHSDVINFDAFLALYPSISESNHCYPISTPVTTTGTSIQYAYSATDYSRSNSPSASLGSLPSTLYSTFGGNVLPVVNGFRIWSFSVKDNCPSDFTLSGGSSASGSAWTELAHPTEVTYQALSWKPFMLSGQSVGYKTMRMILNASPAGMVKLPELQFLICTTGSVTISYPEASYTFYAKYSVVNIVPDAYGVSNCQITPALPNGVSLNPNSCAITGTATTSAVQTVYSVTAQVSGSPASGTVTLTFSDCAGSMLRILRTYKYSPSTEGFRIRNTANDELLLNVPTGNTFPLNRDRVDYFCVTVERYDVTVEGTTDNWSSNSYLYIYELLPEGEEELLAKMRYDSLQANDMTYYLRRHEVSPMEQWYYKMGDVPANWYDDNTTGWSQGVRGSFPESTNQIQLYKKTFTVSDVSVVSGYILSIRYRYGVVVYLNGNEAWRNHMGAGELSATSTASSSYTDAKYRVVTLPGKSIVSSSGESAKEFLKQGTNVIAIAIVGLNAQTARTSLFDATVRLMTNHPEGHLWELSGSITGMYGPASNAFDLDHSTNVYHPSCQSNSMIITLDNDRREWVSSVEIQASYASAVTAVTKFDLYGRVASSDEWTLLTSVSGLTYSDPAQKRRIYFSNPASYNQFRLANLGTGNSLSCTWMLQSVNMYAENVMSSTTPLSYPASASAYVNIEMADVIPEGQGYSNYRIQPALPAGLKFDAFTGWISGTATEEKPSTTYTVTASQITGGDVSVTFNFSVEVCTGGKSLVTMRIRTDEYQNENSAALYRGRGTTGEVIQTVSPFPVKNTMLYLDHCLMDGLYTFLAEDSFGDGWESGAGYTLTADLGEMVLEINQVPLGAKPVQVTTVFSSFFPFQVEFTEWKVYQGAAVAGWTGADFDDAAWETKKAAEIANSESVTTYIRKSFQLTNVEDYQVLNVRMKYAGGVAVYFNGNLVARLNLAEDFDEETESQTVHDATVFSKFHIILPTSGAQEGTNVIAFEVHRPVGTSSSEPFVFDATGVFGVETCSTVLDTYTTIASSSMPRDKIDLLMDFDVFTTTVPSLDTGFFIQWTVENQLGSKWNSYNMLTTGQLMNLGYALYGSFSEQESWDDQITMAQASGQTITDRVKTEFAVPVALVGFRKFRWEILSSASTTTFNTIAFSYCKATGAVCPAVGNYPSVGEGQISASTCPEGYSGYSFRNCAGGVLGEIDTTNCKHKLPKNVAYRPRFLQFVMGTSVSSGLPHYENIVTQWRLRSGEVLPAGLTLNEETGEISGTPTEELARRTFTVIAENPTGAVDVEVDMLVRRGECNAEGVFGRTLVGETAEYKCSSQGSYIGTQRRNCVLGERDGVWEKSSGVCVSLGTIVLAVVVVLVVIAVVVVIVVRKSKRTKSAAGAKAKKTTMKKSAAKVEKGKNVKV